jgi:hypothetical protein
MTLCVCVFSLVRSIDWYHVTTLGALFFLQRYYWLFFFGPILLLSFFRGLVGGFGLGDGEL